MTNMVSTEAKLSMAQPDVHGHFGRYGGRFVPEALIAALDELTTAYTAARSDPEFTARLNGLFAD
ncbi:MAG TPA: tryptophan synthase subunit beta, partial [Pseudonocardiaceae bacterium]|nr:tryptophan synthase subunit beta [Pseudonocardiaceae bacterium]